MYTYKPMPTPGGNYSEFNIETQTMEIFAREEITLTGDDLSWEAGLAGGPIPQELEAWLSIKTTRVYYSNLKLEDL